MITFDPKGILAALDGFAEEVKGPVIRAGSAAAAKVLYDEARALCPVKTGNLRTAIYRVHSDTESTDRKSVYHVSWNRKKAFYGQFVEFGTSKMPARSFLRRAFENAHGDAVKAAEDEMRTNLQHG